jgi:hypothetical protein
MHIHIRVCGLGEAHEVYYNPFLVYFSKGDVCGPLGSSWGTVALIAFGIFLLLSFTGLLKSAYRCPSPASAACRRHIPPASAPAAVTSQSCRSNRIYRERWNFYKLQRYEAQQQQAAQQGNQAAASGRVPLDGMYFDAGQFLDNLQRTQGGGRSLAPVQEEEGNAPAAAPSQPNGAKKTRLAARVDRGDAAAPAAPAAKAGAAALVGVGMGGRGVRVGGEMRSGRASAPKII